MCFFELAETQILLKTEKKVQNILKKGFRALTLTIRSVKKIKFMSPRTDEQYEMIRSEKRKLIMKVALEVFADKTFHGATISMIAQKADISKGLIYNYFESKEALLKEIVKYGVRDVWQYFDPNHDGILTKDEFIFFIRKSIQLIKENLYYWKLYSSLMFQPEVIEMVKSDFDGVSFHYYRLALDLFKRCKIKNPEDEILLFASMMKGAILQFVLMPDAFPIEKFELAIENYYKRILNI